MNIENNIFNKSIFNNTKLLEYGFVVDKISLKEKKVIFKKNGNK